MSTSVIPFAFDSHALRVIVQENQPWFVAADVCAILGLTNPSVAVKPLDAEEKGVSSTYTLGGQQQITTISESGLYTLILRSRDATKPGTVAHRFRKWVTSEVLPSIRRTGSYQPSAATVPADQMAAANAELVSVQRKLIEAQERLLDAAKPKPKPRRKAQTPIMPDEVAEMRKLRAQGMAVKAIAHKTGRSEGAVSWLTRSPAP